MIFDGLRSGIGFPKAVVENFHRVYDLIKFAPVILYQMAGPASRNCSTFSFERGVLLHSFKRQVHLNRVNTIRRIAFH